MKEEPNMQKLLHKFINNNCDEHEIKAIIDYVKCAKGTGDLPSFKEVMEQFKKIPDIEQNRAQDIYHKILKISKRKKQTFLPRSIWKYAAASVLVGILATSYFFRVNFFDKDVESTAPIIVNTKSIIPGTYKATLTLEDGSTVFLEKDDVFHSENASNSGEGIIYNASEQNTTKIVYNYLTIPRGGEYFVKLPDGTQVWLNSESQLKFPVRFIHGETRKVELVYGEAYFDVSPSSLHKGSKFKVFNNAQEVEVLGTEFNIKAYKDETHVYTTLVEGKVVVDNGLSKQNLIPNQQSNLDTKTNSIIIAKVDVKGEISWRNGVFSFIDMPLKDIMKVISRWYDVDVIFENKELETIEFLGVIDKSHSIDKILSIMKSTSINSYKINNKTIILK